MSIAALYHFAALPSLVPQGHGSAQKPPILPVRAPNAHLILVRIATGKARAPSSYHSVQIFGMNCNFSRSVRVSQLRQAGIFNPVSIPKLNGPVGSKGASKPDIFFTI